MRKGMMWMAIAVMSVCSVVPTGWTDRAQAQTVFQAAGPTQGSIQATVDAFRAALGDPHREINWDGGGNPATTDPVTPFNVFLNTRGAQFTTPGTGLSQATPAGLAVLFNNPAYEHIFTAFSPSRLFTPVGSRITEGLFFVPGTNGGTPAAVTGFGAVFTDVDTPNGGKSEKHSTRIEYLDADGRLLFIGLVPSSPGDEACLFSASCSTSRGSPGSGSPQARPDLGEMTSNAT